MSRKPTSRAAIALDCVEKPQWLLTPPDQPAPPPPVSTRSQLLPFEKLGWRDFERLCLRLGACEGEAEHWQLYGTAGQAQGGIDLLVRRSGAAGYTVWQSKRYQAFAANDIRKAVDKFLAGPWVSRSDRFVLAVACDLDETELADAIEAAADRLKTHKITFVPMGAARLSEALKNKPEIIDDFFGRAWVRDFCGEDAAKTLGNRFSRQDFSDVRQALKTVYANHFATVDPGVLRAASGLDAPPRALPLARRFVFPEFTRNEAAPVFSERAGDRQPVEPPVPGAPASRQQRPRQNPATTIARRITLAGWASGLDRAIVLGAPGAGKSTLLRFLALDLLAEESLLDEARRRWPDYLPVLLSFPFWTRMIQQGVTGASLSVARVARAWFEQLGETKTAQSIEQAFEDGRVILLVDGVDEWSDETAAATAMSMLHTFVATKGLPTVITSRPQGSRVLTALDASWTRQELAPLSIAQQKAFAKAWYEWLDEIDERTEGDAAARAANFIDTLHKTPQVARLAAVPLLLGGLMALRREAALPRSRFHAYQELASRLLVSHPMNRSRAALTPVRQHVLDVATHRKLLTALAYTLQERRGAATDIDSLSAAEAIATVKAALIEQLDLPADKARTLATELLNVGADTLGILVERAPGQLGFFHRAIQEILAAEHLAALDLDDQLVVFASHGHDPQWRDVLLFTAQFALRPTDVERFTGALEAGKLSPVAAGDRDLLLAEIAFGEVNRSAPLTRRLVSRFLDEIESGQSVAPRRALLRLAISGILSDQTAIHIRPRLDGWFPSWHVNHYHDAYEAMRQWNIPGCDAALLRGLQADTVAARAQAAESLAARKKGDPGYADILFALVAAPPTIEAQAAAIRALLLGWSDDPRFAPIADRAARSGSWAVGAAGIAARIAAGRHDEDDRDRLIDWLRGDIWERGEEIGVQLVAGWSGDGAMKAQLIELVEDPGLTEEAMIIAARAFPGDKAVASKIAKRLRAMTFRANVRGLAEALGKCFPGNARIAAALISGEREDALQFRLNHAAHVTQAPSLKSRLIASLATRRPHEFWAIAALVEFWSDDEEACAAVRIALTWSPERQLRVAEQLPSMLDKSACLHLLRSLIPVACDKYPDGLFGIFNALQSLGGLPDASLTPALLDAYWHAEVNGDEAFPFLIALFQADAANETVRKLALQWLRRPESVIGLISHFYHEDAGVRAEIVKLAAPLPEELRSELADALIEIADVDDTTLELLNAARQDTCFEIAANAQVRYAAALRARGPIPDEFTDYLISRLELDEFFYEAKRFAALAALAAAGRLDCVDELWSRVYRLAPISLDHPGRIPETVLQTLAEHWPQIARLAEQHPNWLSTHDDRFVAIFERYMQTYPDVAVAIRAAVERLKDKDYPPLVVFRLASQNNVMSPEILSKVVRRLGTGRSWVELESSVAAATLLAERFAGRPDIKAMITARLDDGETDGPIAALCDGWPDSVRLDRFFEEVRSSEPLHEKLSFPVQLKLIATKSDASVVVKALVSLGDMVSGDVGDGPSMWLPNMQRRIAADDEVAEGIWEALKRAESANAKVTLTALFAKGRGIDAGFREWCEEELARPIDGFAEVGFDATRRQAVLVNEHLRELLA